MADNAGFMASLRAYLAALPQTGEAQVIARYLEVFARDYMQHGAERSAFASEDACYVLAYTVIMLNVDAYHVLRPGKTRMTLSDFVRQVAECNDGGNYDLALLRGIYASVYAQELTANTATPPTDAV